MNYVVATRTAAFGTVCSLSHTDVVTVVYSHFFFFSSRDN